MLAPESAPGRGLLEEDLSEGALVDPTGVGRRLLSWPAHVSGEQTVGMRLGGIVGDLPPPNEPNAFNFLP